MYKLKKKTSEKLGYLINATYSKKYRKPILIFFDPVRQQTFRWHDNYNHSPSFLTNASPIKAASILKKRKHFRGVEEVEKYNAILDKNIKLTRVNTVTPMVMGAKNTGSFRVVLENAGYKTWEAWINYIDSYVYDMNLEMGMPYMVSKEKVVPLTSHEHNSRVKHVLGEIGEHTDITDLIVHWVRLFEAPVPSFKLVATDIEVLPASIYRMPEPELAEQPIITISFVTSDGRKISYVLKREETILDPDVGVNGEVRFFDSEKELIIETFKMFSLYPLVVTFNGDGFDMLYLHNRAINFGIHPTQIPIYITRGCCKLKKGLHLDLFPFLKNPSIQNYAYKGKYKSFGLDAISKAILDKNKIEFDEPIGELSYNMLINYCLNDSELVYELCIHNDNSLINLVLMLIRMSNLNFYDLTRKSIGKWVSGTFFYLSRQMNWLIPSSDGLATKGKLQTLAKIKGKKYEGAIVKVPRSGIFFNVVVVDFASLYPSEVKERNIGFGTVNCPHQICMANKVPDTTHHICTINRAIEADVIGGLKDTRVFFYKGESKNKDNPLHKFYELLEQAIKVYINAAYGVFGSEYFSLYCFPNKTFMYANDYIYNVEQMKEGDIIHNSLGSRQNIIRKFKRDYDGYLIKINGRGLLPFEITPEHPIAISTRKVNTKYLYVDGKQTTKRDYIFSSVKWIEASKLDKIKKSREVQDNKQYLVLPKYKVSEDYIIDLTKYKIDTRGGNSGKKINEKISLTEEVAYILGLYLAEGSSNGNVVNWSFGSTEKDLAEKSYILIKEIFGKVGTTKTMTTNRVYVCSKQLQEFMREKFGHGAYNKDIPQFIMDAPKNIVKSFISGYLEGDGHVGTNHIEFSTVSPFVSLRLQKLFTKLNIMSSITMSNRGDTAIIEGRKVNTHPIQYKISVYSPYLERFGFIGSGKNIRYYGEDENNFYIPIKDIEYNEYEGKVYNFETEDHTIQVSNILTHNCPPVAESIASYSRRDMQSITDRAEVIKADPFYGDSIVGDTLVAYKYDDKTYITKMEYMYMRMMLDSLFNMRIKNGKEYIEINSENPVFVPSMDDKGNVSYGIVSKIIRHRTSKSIFNILTKYGFIKVTGDHSLIEYKNGQFLEIKPWEVNNSTMLVHSRHNLEQEYIDNIDLYDYIDKQKYIVTDDKIYIASPTGCKKSVIKKSRIPFKRHWEGDELKKLCWFLGFFAAEGSTTDKGRKLARISNQDGKMIQKAIDFQKLSTGRNTKAISEVDKRTGNSITHVNLSSIVEYNIYHELIGSGFKNKKIPEFIYQLNTEFQKCFIEGESDGDGTHNPIGSVYELHTSSSLLADGLMYLIRNLGYVPTVGYRKEKDSYRVRAQLGNMWGDSQIINDVIITPVKNVELISANEEWVYDFEILPHHTFVAGGGNFVLHNTDSVFLNNPTTRQIELLQRWASEELKMDLGIDKTYRYAIFSERKKNYLGIMEDGTPDIKGLTGKKKQIPPIIKKVFFEVVDELCDIHSLEEYQERKAKILDIILKTYNKIKDREWDNIKDMVYNVRLSMDLDNYKVKAQHVKAGKMLRAMGYDIKAGDDIFFLKTTTNEGVLPLQDDFNSRHIDVDAYLSQMKSVFLQLTESMDIDWDYHIEGKPIQFALVDFMKKRE